PQRSAPSFPSHPRPRSAQTEPTPRVTTARAPTATHSDCVDRSTPSRFDRGLRNEQLLDTKRDLGALLGVVAGYHEKIPSVAGHSSAREGGGNRTGAEIVVEHEVERRLRIDIEQLIPGRALAHVPGSVLAIATRVVGIVCAVLEAMVLG